MRTPISYLLLTAQVRDLGLRVGLGVHVCPFPCFSNSGSLVRREGSWGHNRILGPLLPHSPCVLLGTLPWSHLGSVAAHTSWGAVPAHMHLQG